MVGEGGKGKRDDGGKLKRKLFSLYTFMITLDYGSEIFVYVP